MKYRITASLDFSEDILELNDKLTEEEIEVVELCHIEQVDTI